MARRSLLVLLPLLLLAVCIKTATATAATSAGDHGISPTTATTPCGTNEMTALTNHTENATSNATIWSEEERQESTLYESDGVTIRTSNDTFTEDNDNGNDSLLDYEPFVSFGLFAACLVVLLVKFVRTHRKEMADMESRNHDNMTVAASEWDIASLDPTSVAKPPSQTNRAHRRDQRIRRDRAQVGDDDAMSAIPTVITASMATTSTNATSAEEYGDEQYGDLDDASVFETTIDQANRSKNDVDIAVNAASLNDCWRGQDGNADGPETAV